MSLTLVDLYYYLHATAVIQSLITELQLPSYYPSS